MPYANIEKRRERARERDAMKRSGNWIPKPPVRQADEIQCSHCSKPFYRPPANRLNRVSSGLKIVRGEDEHKKIALWRVVSASSTSHSAGIAGIAMDVAVK